MFANIVAALKGTHGPLTLARIQSRITHFSAGRQLIAVLDEYFGHEKILQARTALMVITSLACTRMADLDWYLTKLRLMMIHILQGGEGITDGALVELILRHLRGMGELKATILRHLRAMDAGVSQ